MAKAKLTALPKLEGEQARASAPEGQVRLSASAGTGKTQVLSARVLRLLLHGVRPESILCLTFTKAGAAEMADRIHERLGGWVTMAGGDLGKDLENLGEDISPEDREKARSLFAKVLDARGSGLRIQTIHSFCQSLLASFPAEAGLPLGFRPIEGREEDQLAARALADLVVGFMPGELDRFKATAKRLSEKTMRAFLRRCAAAPEAMEALGSGIEPKVRRWLSNGIDNIQEVLELACCDDAIDVLQLETVRNCLANWRKKDGGVYADGVKSLNRLNEWLAADDPARVADLPKLRLVWRTGEDKWRSKAPDDPEFASAIEQLDSWIKNLLDLRNAALIAPAISDALQTGQAYARAYADAKRTASVVDFNDLIRSTVSLLKTPGIGDWVRFKLDQSVDHILVDEAQDSNADQWEIVKSLAGEFFAGDGAKAGIRRTIFKVGDYKQAIFGFQGTDPRQFEEAEAFFATEVAGADQDYLRLSLSQSFRSSQPILDVTDAVIGALGFGAFGLPEAPALHVSARGGSGSIMLLPPVYPVPDEDEAETEAEEGWISDADLRWADKLAKQVAHWTTGGLRLRNQARNAEPGDVMILLRKRGELARLIVSRLYQEGVAVAGVDRLQLGAPIAVRDLLACIRFVLQPEDNLSLASLLVSPLIGWSQDQLYEAAKGRAGGLWQHLGDAKPAFLVALLRRTDFSTPYQFLESIVSDPVFEGRKRLIERLGEEARDPIEELLNAALAFEKQATPSLQLFLDWFDRGDVEIKRDPAKPENAVRVMTVHGAKGLQAPIVILADATFELRPPPSFDWEPEPGLKIPLVRPKSSDLVGSLKESAESQDAKEAEEHWRLLYVAMTRAEEHLIVGGALGPMQAKAGMSDQCWHVQIARALDSLGAEKDGDMRVLRKEEPEKKASRDQEAVERHTGALPDWALRQAAPEARPPRPLAPSAILPPDDEASPPPGPEMQKTARRGVLLHSLFERLPAVAAPDRAATANNWLKHSAGVGDAQERSELVAAALRTISFPGFEAIFGSEALAEAPLAGVVAGRVIVGTMDRLLVGDAEVLVVDFKTGRRVPQSADAVSTHHKAQMAAYAAVLEGMFPGRIIRAALLYASGPSLIELPAAMLQAHKPGFSDAQQEFDVAS